MTSNERGATISPVDWRAVGAYVALACGLAWTAEGIALARGVRFTSLTLGTTALLAVVMVTPAIAAFIVRRFITREGFATAGLRFGPRRPYLVVWLGMPLLVAGIYALTVLIGLGRFDPTLAQLTAKMEEVARGQPIPALPSPLVLATAMFAQSLTFGVLITSLFAFGEEFGWTGYLLVRLLPLGRWRAALLYGAIWGLWHAPIIAGGYNYPGYPVLGPVMMCLLTIAFALTQTALRLRYDSVYLTSFFHASINTHGLGNPSDVRGRRLAGPWRGHGYCWHRDVHGPRRVAPRSNARISGRARRQCLTAAWKHEASPDRLKRQSRLWRTTAQELLTAALAEYAEKNLGLALRAQRPRR